MYTTFSKVFIFFTSCLIESEHLNVRKKSIRNFELDNIYKTENLIWDVHQCSKSCCFTSCLEHIDCRSFAYHSDDKRCQIFNRNFKNQNVSGAAVFGMYHYDLENGMFFFILLKKCLETLGFDEM